MSNLTESVTVVVVNYRTARLTGELVGRARTEWGSVAIAVCDNSDDDSEWQSLNSAVGEGAATTRADGNPGFGAAVNLMLARVETPFGLLMNPDLLDLPDLPGLLATASRTGAAVTGPMVSDEAGRVRGTFGGPPRLGSFARYVFPVPGGARSLMASRKPRAPIVDVGWVTGACMLVEVEAWRQAPFDEDLFLYAEDIDFCWRQRDAGRRVILDASRAIRHSGGASSGGTAPLLWATNLARVGERRVRGARLMLSLGLGLRGLRQLVLGDRHGASYLFRSAHAARMARREPAQK
jgi:N-acetylglucosaminyl-diphospho-decaprenol L-rhamnosyltransferase